MLFNQFYLSLKEKFYPPFWDNNQLIKPTTSVSVSSKTLAPKLNLMSNVLREYNGRN